MKLNLGNRLATIREGKKLSQIQMADLLTMSPASYGRLERNETTANFEDLARYSKALDIPVADLLPELMTIYNNNNTNQSGLIFGNIYNYYDVNEYTRQLETSNRMLKEELEKLKRDN